MITKFQNFISEANIKIKIELPKDILKIKEEFDKNGKKLYVVGGAVRDFYLNRKPHDIDLVTDALPEESIKILKGKFKISDEQGKSFGVLRIYTDDEPSGYELATFRRDISKGRDTKGSDKKVEIGKHITIEDDVKRRDLTQNALFYDIDKEEIVDLVGGLDDINKNIISAVGNPSERFIEDRLRILRTFRFASRSLSEISKGTEEAIRKDKRLRNISPIDDVSQERIVEEFMKAIDWAKDHKKIDSLNYYFKLLEEYDLFEEMFPGLNININDIASFDIFVILALLFRDNDVDTLKLQLKKYKFSNVVVDIVCFLLNIKDNVNDVNNIHDLYKEKLRIKAKNSMIKQFSNILGFNNKYLNAFLEFEPKINAIDLMNQGFRGVELGREIKRKEIEQFSELLNEEYDPIENFDRNFKEGDVVVAILGEKIKKEYTEGTKVHKDILTRVFSNNGSLAKNNKYIIAKIIDTSDYGQSSKNFPVVVKDIYGNIVISSKYDKPVYFKKENFILLKDWEFLNNMKNFNL